MLPLNLKVNFSQISEWGQKTLSKMQLTVIGHDSLHIFEPEPLEDVFV